MLKRLLVLLAAFALAACGATSQVSSDSGTTTAEGATYQQVSQEEAAQMMASEEDYVILDVRTASEYAEGHIPGAINVPNESIGTGPVPELPDLDQLILVYCRSGNRSKKASEKLAAIGYTNVVEFGGINTWTGEVVTE